MGVVKKEVAEPELSEMSTSVELSDLKKVLKKDFKLKGTIGMPGQKDRLTFSSLAYQMDNGEKKGYNEVEICEEVIRAVSVQIFL